jgi:rod shape-determining protein MreD
MKSALFAIGLVFSLISQLFFMQTWQVSSITGNIVLAFLVVISLYSTNEQELWLCLFAGLFSDLYSSVDFGFYLGFYLLIGILTKYVFKFGEIEHSWWRPIVLIGAAALVQGIVLSIPIFGTLSLLTVTQRIIPYVILSMIAGLIWYLVFAQAIDFVRRVNIPKHMR